MGSSSLAALTDVVEIPNILFRSAAATRWLGSGGGSRDRARGGRAGRRAARASRREKVELRCL